MKRNYRITSYKFIKDFCIAQYAGVEPADYDKTEIEKEIKIKKNNVKLVFFRPREN